MQPITHFELCKETAAWIIKKSRIVLYEYQSFATGEFPDVLAFHQAHTTLFEIKVDYQDFRRDPAKECRIKTVINYYPQFRCERGILKKIEWRQHGMTEFIRESPHLGRRRYYVCPTGMIQKDEVPNGWGLYWYNGKFRKIKESKHFRPNMYEEMRILEHAFRKFYCGDGKNIMVRGYR